MLFPRHEGEFSDTSTAAITEFGLEELNLDKVDDE